MLSSLSIKNFALIDQLELDFQAGLSIITGETGAGKTILLQALGLLSGGKCESHSIREVSEKLCVEGLFENEEEQVREFLHGLGLDDEDIEGGILLRREVSSAGKSKMSVNGRLLRLNDARKLAALLFNIHSQHDTTRLLDPGHHASLLREFGSEALQDLYDSYLNSFSNLKELRERKKSMLEKTQQILREKDRLESELQEISEVSPDLEEEQSLHSSHQRLVHLMEIQTLLDQVESGLDASEEGSFGFGLHQMVHDLQAIERMDSQIEKGVEIANQVDLQIQELKSVLNEYRASLDHDESLSLDEVESRMSAFEALKRKYGATLEEVLEYEKNCAERLFELKDEQGNLEKIDDLLKDAEISCLKLAKRLERELKDLSSKLQKEMNDILAHLAMEGSEFQVCSCELSRGVILENGIILGENGLKNYEFFLKANKGSEALPLAKCASGGEVSRVMLALKKVFVNSHPASIFVFDEIDTGIGGHTAHRLAEVIEEISANKQVFVITHLPQIATRARQHYFVQKSGTSSGKTQSTVSLLDHNSRRSEIARMMGLDQEGQSLPNEVEEILQNRAV